MLSKLSRRERTLLCALAVVLVVAGAAYGLILPMNARNRALEGEVALLEAQLGAINAVLQAENALDAHAVAALEARLLPAMTDWEADRLLTGLIHSAGLEAQSLALSNAPTHRAAEAVATGSLSGLEALLDSVAEVEGLGLTTVGYTAAGGGHYRFVLGFALYSRP